MGAHVKQAQMCVCAAFDWSFGAPQLIVRDASYLGRSRERLLRLIHRLHLGKRCCEVVAVADQLVHLQRRSSVSAAIAPERFLRLTGAGTGKCKACTAYAAAERCNRNVSALHMHMHCVALPTHLHCVADARASFGTSSRRLLCATAGPAAQHGSMAWHGMAYSVQRTHTQHSSRQGKAVCCRTN